MSKKPIEEKLLTEEQEDAMASSALVPADRDSVTVAGAIDYASMDTVTFHAAAVSAVDELRCLSDQCGLVIYTKIVPALSDAKRRFDAGEKVNGCNGIEEYIESFGLKPATVRKWRQRAAERDLSKQVRLLTGEAPTPKPKPLLYSRKQKERLLAAASIVGGELIPAYENGHDISGPLAELKKIAFDSEELNSIVNAPEKRENPLALSLARHVKKLFTELFTVRRDIYRVEVKPQGNVYGVFLEGANGGEGKSPIDTLMDRVPETGCMIFTASHEHFGDLVARVRVLSVPLREGLSVKRRSGICAYTPKANPCSSTCWATFPQSNFISSRFRCSVSFLP